MRASDAQYVTPDIYVKKIDGEWATMLNEDGMPRLKHLGFYRNALSGSSDTETKKYVTDKLNSAAVADSQHPAAAEDHRQGHREHREVPADFFEKGVDLPQAPHLAGRRGRYRHARVHRQPGHQQQIRPHAPRHLRAQVLLQLLHQQDRSQATTSRARR
jgi:hypothetical protein